MTTESESMQSLAREAFECFVTRKRANDDLYTAVRDDAPEWVSELVQYAHGDMLPDDWRYAAIRSALECIAESADEDSAHEWADAEVDAYTSDLIAWLGSHSSRPAYCDEAVESMGVANETNIMGRISLGQYQEAREVYALVHEFLDKRVNG